MVAQAQQPIPLESPGYYGLNTELSPMHTDHRYALRADNAVIDELGRLCSREAFKIYTNTNDLNLASPDDVDFELTRMGVGYWADTHHCIAAVWAPTAKTAHLVRVEATGLFNIPIPTLPNPEGFKRAQIIEFRERLYVFSEGNPVISTDASTADFLSNDPAFKPPMTGSGATPDPGTPIVTDIDGTVACSAYGRLWVAGVNGEYDRIYYSDLLIPTQWFDGRAFDAANPGNTPGYDTQNSGGIIDVREYWPDGDDRIEGLVAHNGFLIVFGRRSIIVYANPQGDPAGSPGIQMADALSGIGLISRDAIVNIGSDLLFLDKSGVRSFGRTIQEKSIPLGDMSANIKRVVKKRIVNEPDWSSISMWYSRNRGIVGLLFPEDRDAYIFSIKEPTETGALKVTHWTECDFNHATHIEWGETNETFLAGRRGSGARIYRDYDPVDSYDFHFESVSCALSPIQTQKRYPKRIVYSLAVQKIDEDAIAWWGYDNALSYSQNFRIVATNIAYFTNPGGDPTDHTVPATHVAHDSAMFNIDRFGDKAGDLRDYKINAQGKGTYFRVGLQVPIHGGGRVAIQEITVHTLLGRID